MSPSRWAETYRVGKDGPWRFPRHPWTKEMHDTTADFNVGQKSAQMGYSEVMLNVVFYKMDVEGVSVLYILPNLHPDATVFSASRFDDAISLSPHIRNMFSDVKNIQHKKAGTANLYIRGSRSEAGLRSLPVEVIIFDEVDVMVEKNIPLAFHRTDGQEKRLIWMVSTPTIENHGINTYFKQSTQEHFFFKCPSCSRQIELTFPESLVVTAEERNDPGVENSHLICTLCKAKLPHELKPEWMKNAAWVPTVKGFDYRGFYVNQLYSFTDNRSPVELAKEWLEARYNPAKKTEFHNSSMGLTFSMEGAKLTEAQIKAAMGSHKNDTITRKNGVVTMGVDVNHPFCNFVITQWFPPARWKTTDPHSETPCKVLAFGTLQNFNEIIELEKIFQFNYIVIDAQPERREATRIAEALYGKCSICFYTASEASKVITENPKQLSINVHRTTWMDTTLSRFREKNISLPVDTTEEFREHLMAPERHLRPDQNDNPVARYITKDGEQDHFAHALVYSEIAYACVLGSTETVENKGPL